MRNSSTAFQLRRQWRLGYDLLVGVIVLPRTYSCALSSLRRRATKKSGSTTVVSKDVRLLNSIHRHPCSSSLCCRPRSPRPDHPRQRDLGCRSGHCGIMGTPDSNIVGGPRSESTPDRGALHRLDNCSSLEIAKIGGVKSLANLSTVHYFPWLSESINDSILACKRREGERRESITHNLTFFVSSLAKATNINSRAVKYK